MRFIFFKCPPNILSLVLQWSFASSLLLFNLPAHSEPFSVQSDIGVKAIYETNKALLIGASEYNKIDWNRLDTVPKEIEMIKVALMAQGFAEKDITVVMNPGSTRLQDALKDFLFQKTSRDTRLLVFFAGHGWSDSKSTGYIVPVDSLGEENPSFRQKLVSMSEIKEWSYKSRAKHIMFIFDSCFSGAVFLTRSNLKPSALFLSDADRPVRQFITSGSADEEVPAISEFAEKLIEGMNGAADIFKDGIITGNELGYWLKASITPLGKQTPQFGSSNIEEWRAGDMLFRAINAKPAVLGLAGSKPIPIKASTGAEKKGRILRSLGKPEEPTKSYFEGIEVYYYLKLADGSTIKDALDAAKIPYLKTRASLPDKFKVNAIACNPDVPIEVLRSVALALVEKGVPLQLIFPYKYPKNKPRRLELLSFIRNGKLPATAPLTVEQIQQLDRCKTISN